MLRALTRQLSPAIAQCELTHLERAPIDFPRAVEQHRKYEDALASLGCEVLHLPPLPDNPDAVFVEDTAVVLPELAIITRPGAESRRNETPSVVDALGEYRPLAFIEAPGTLDGGDVMILGSTIFVGESTRTNAGGIRQLSELASPHGYKVHSIRVSGCLHLKSAVTRIADDVVLLNPHWVNASEFRGVEHIEVDPSEPAGANALPIASTLLYPAGFTLTAESLELAGFAMCLIDVDELQKAEGAVTCCSILFEL